jgi:hypothetical protein
MLNPPAHPAEQSCARVGTRTHYGIVVMNNKPTWVIGLAQKGMGKGWTRRPVIQMASRSTPANRATLHTTPNSSQRLLLHSWSARLLAVRQVAQDNRGKRTAGVDGVKSLTPPNASPWHSPLPSTAAPPLSAASGSRKLGCFSRGERHLRPEDRGPYWAPCR